MTSYLIERTTSSKVKNEDSLASAINNNLNMKAIIIGDGIGSHYKPDEGSEFCVNSLKNYLQECQSLDELDFQVLFKKVHQDLQEKYGNITDETIDRSQSYGTTLICAVELRDKYILAYLGNGSIWHIRGNFYKFSPQRYLPWNAINILNPHTVEENGKEALYKFMALDVTEKQIQPSVIEISKDNDLFGDIIILSTDGLYSNDQIPIAKDREDNIWIAGEKKMELLFNRLKKLAIENQLEEEKVSESMDEYLKEISDNKLIDDDTTFGIFINNIAVIDSEQKELN